MHSSFRQLNMNERRIIAQILQAKSGLASAAAVAYFLCEYLDWSNI